MARKTRHKGKQKLHEVWYRGWDGEVGFVEAFKDKGEAQRRITRLSGNQSGATYFIKSRKSPSRRAFGSRASRRHTLKNRNRRDLGVLSHMFD